MSRRTNWGRGWVVGIALIVAACGGGGDDGETQQAGAAQAPARGVYALEGTTGDLLILALPDADRYWSWRNTAECRDLSVLRDSCEEQGRYAVTGTTLTLTPDDRSEPHRYPFVVGPPETTASATVAPKAGGLVGGSSGAIVGSGQATTAPAQSLAANVSVGGQAMTLVRRGVELLTSCRASDEGSGAIPGQASPNANFANGRFTSGPFAPGGQYDPRTVASGASTLYATASTTDHHYAVMSDRLPAGTTFARANAALQRFNGPTGPAMSGQGDDPNATFGWVVDPLTNEVPTGCVTFERGNGWARNTTAVLHPFVGTITRYVVDGGNGSYRILTVGEGVTPPSANGDSVGGYLLRSAQETVSGARNVGNVVGGPLIFKQLDRQLINSVR